MFTCLRTRAMLIDVIASTTTTSFINADLAKIKGQMKTHSEEQTSTGPAKNLDSTEIILI